MAAMHRRRLGNVVTGVVSILFLVFAAAYLVTPARTALAMQVQEASVQVPARTVVIYGKVTDYRSKPVKGVRIRLTRRGRTTFRTSSGSRGVFRKSTRVRAPGKYRITASHKHRGTVRRASKTLRLRPRRAYRVTIRLIRSGGLTLIPVRGY